MRALIIARVSTEEQQEAGNSLPAQVERMKAYCARKGLDFNAGDIYSFDESAYKTKRDEFDKILERIEENKDKAAVCFDKIDRFSRNVFDKRVATLYELAMRDIIELHFVSDNLVVSSKMSANEKFQYGIGLGLAKYFSDAISDNTRRAFEEKRRRGEWTGHPPIGYIQVQERNEKGEVLSRDIIPDPERTHLIIKLFELYATGSHSIRSLQNEITRMGLKGLGGKKLYRSNIERIIKDGFYWGMATSKKYGTYPHRYKVLILKELFERCQRVREGRGAKRSKVLSKPFILKGLLHCHKCGCLMSPEIKKGKFIYYSCTNAKDTCRRIYVPERELLKPIKKVFERFESIPQEVHDRLVGELRAISESEAVFLNREITRIRMEYDRIQGRIERMLYLRLDGSISEVEYTKKLQDMKSKQERLNIESEEYTKADHQYHLHVSHVISLSKRMGKVFESSEPDEKREILGYLLQNPTVDGKKLRFTLRKPYQTVLELATICTVLPG